MFLQLQFEAFYTVNLLNAKWKVVLARNSSWKKRVPSVISSKVRLFADDCLVYREIKSRQDQNDLQKDLNSLESWGSTWGMRFNAAKCNIMRVSRKQTPIPYQYELSGQVLEEVKDAKYLGVTVSDDLEWTKHIDVITSKANSKYLF